MRLRGKNCSAVCWNCPLLWGMMHWTLCWTLCIKQLNACVSTTRNLSTRVTILRVHR